MFFKAIIDIFKLNIVCSTHEILIKNWQIVLSAEIAPDWCFAPIHMVTEYA